MDNLQRVDGTRLDGCPGRKLDKRRPQRRQRGGSVRVNELLLVVLDHRLQNHALRVGDLRRRCVDDLGHGRPVVSWRVRVLLLGRAKVAQRYRRETRTEARHAVEMRLLRNPSPVVPPPPYPGASLLGLFAAPVTPENRADNAELG